MRLAVLRRAAGDPSGRLGDSCDPRRRGSGATRRAVRGDDRPRGLRAIGGCGRTAGAAAGSPFGTIADIANYTTINPTTFTAAQYNGRLDANVTEKDHIGFAIYWVPLSKDNYNGDRTYDIFQHNQINDALSAIWDHTFSPNLLNEFRVNAAGWRWNEIDSNPQSPVGFPTDNIGTIGGVTVNSFGPNVGSKVGNVGRIVVPVPEPSTLSLVFGAAALGIVRRALSQRRKS